MEFAGAEAVPGNVSSIKALVCEGNVGEGVVLEMAAMMPESPSAKRESSCREIWISESKIKQEMNKRYIHVLWATIFQL